MEARIRSGEGISGTEDPTGTDADNLLQRKGCRGKGTRKSGLVWLSFLYSLEGDNFRPDMPLRYVLLPTLPGEPSGSREAGWQHRPSPLPALPSPGLHTLPRGGSVSPLTPCGRMRPSCQAEQAGEDEEMPVLPPTCIPFPAWAAACAKEEMQSGPGFWDGQEGPGEICHLFLFGFLFCFVVVADFLPLPFIFPATIRNIFFFFFFGLSCWPPCLPYVWGYLRRISRRIGP